MAETLPVVKSITIAPTGLSISRNGMSFTVNWKIGDASYSSQTVNYRCLNSAGAELVKWTNVAVQSGDTSASFSVSSGLTTLNKVEVRVRGIRGRYEESNWIGINGKRFHVMVHPDWSSWATITMPIYAPSTPALNDAWDSSSASTSNFSYSISETTAPLVERPIYGVEYQTMWLTGCNVAPSQLSWDRATVQRTTTLSGNITFTETGLVGSKTRVIRLRGYGPAGPGAWAYSSHVYAAPYTPIIRDAKASKGTGGNTANLTVVWTQQVDLAYPTDYCQVEYLITTPAAGVSVPSSATFTPLDQVTITRSGNNTYYTNVPSLPDENEVMFVRVNAIHGNRNTYSQNVKVVMKGALSAPSGVAITTYPATHQAKITATNNASSVPDSFLTIEWREKGKSSFIAGIIPHGQTEVTITVPAWTNAVAVAVQAVVGGAAIHYTSGGVNYYTVVKQMESTIVEQGGNVPLAPKNVTVTPNNQWSGAAQVTWQWSWAEADTAEVSWSENLDAWESTKPPTSYEVPSVYAGKWTVPDLTMGVRWYFRVRFMQHNGEVITYGPYSAPVSLVLYSAPAVPALTLSTGVAAPSDTVTASWAYVSTDGTQQAYAELDTVPAGTRPVARVSTGQSTSFKPASYGWTAGSTQYLRVRVVSESGMTSEWSEAVPLTIAPEINLTMTDVSLTNGKLTALPLTATVTGAGNAGTTSVAIERITDYKMMRPDGKPSYGYNGETVALVRFTGEGQVSIGQENIIPGGHLDDGAAYALVASIKDVYGRKRTAKQNFTVEWTHKAQAAEATVTLQDDVVRITPTAQSGGAAGDYADIYRLSVDGPQLIYHQAEFGTTYVDPYPTIGEFGGYRIVYCTANGDYVSDDGNLMWKDYQVVYHSINNIINTAEDRIELMYNVEQTDSWDKEFTETKYLGGSVVGDWLAGVTRKSGINADVIRDETPKTTQAIRKLAEYPGRCHVRTVDGSNYWADVQVSRTNGYSSPGRTVGVSLTITRVDQETPDGIPLTEWETE